MTNYTTCDHCNQPNRPCPACGLITCRLICPNTRCGAEVPLPKAEPAPADPEYSDVFEILDNTGGFITTTTTTSAEDAMKTLDNHPHAAVCRPHSARVVRLVAAARNAALVLEGDDVDTPQHAFERLMRALRDFDQLEV